MQTPVTLTHWIGFNFIIFSLLGIDLYRFFRFPHPIKIKEALLTSAVWISFALIFNIWIYFTFGPQPALNFFTGYLLEETLSIDNLFIFLLLFSHFKVPETSKHQVLFYGILGAIVMRALMIWGGIVLIHYFEWIFILLGVFLVITGIRLAFNTEKGEKGKENLIYSWLKKWLPLTNTYQGNAFIVQMNGRWMATPLLVVLILIEITDLIFALDSVPAILGITTEPFIVYTSNIFAILGLRSLFFALEGFMKTFYFLHYALAFILVFIGCKMILAQYVELPTWIALLVLVTSITLAGVCFFLKSHRKKGQNRDEGL